MVPPEYHLDARNLAAAARDWPLPLAFVGPGDSAEAPPPFPLIALDRTAVLADVVVEAPASAEAVIAEISARPHAAAVAVQLLRAIEGMSPASALAAESLAYGLLQGSAEHAHWLVGRTAAVVGEGRVLLAREGDVLTVTIDRPEARNAIDRGLRDGLFEAFTLAGLDPDLREVRLRSTGGAFSIGADLAEFGTTRDPATAHAIRSRTLPAHAILGCADKLDVHVQGACIGAGLEMAAFARRVTASPRAWFQLPELAMGLIPGAGGCVSVSRRIGRQRTALMILSGRRVSARTALEWGLIDAIVDDSATDDRGPDALGTEG